MSSATIDTERFSAHFGGAPVVEVVGRTFPVDVRYRPPPEDADLADAVADAVQVLALDPGDVSCSSPASGRSATPPKA